jgi:predicted GNAT superfamily acetyltransferase
MNETVPANSSADDAVAPAAITVRPLAGSTELHACVALQRLTWGDGFHEIVAPSLLAISQRVGGIAAGAFDAEGGLVGFVYGMAGVEHGLPVHWSHMLAVLPEHRDRGIGRLLKEYQREELRRRGVVRVYWTFDPLVARNAHLNLTRLRVEAVEYVPDMYGDTGSGLHQGLGTDRLIVSWRLDSPARSPVDPAAWLDAPEANGTSHVDRRRVRIAIPADIHEVLAADENAARAWRNSTRRAFQAHLQAGWRLAGFERDSAGGGSYLLVKSGPNS